MIVKELIEELKNYNQDAEIINTSYVPKRNKELHSQRRISAYDFKFDGERLEELKEKFFIGKLHRIAWGRKDEQII